MFHNTGSYLLLPVHTTALLFSSWEHRFVIACVGCGIRHWFSCYFYLLFCYHLWWIKIINYQLNLWSAAKCVQRFKQIEPIWQSTEWPMSHTRKHRSRCSCKKNDFEQRNILSSIHSIATSLQLIRRRNYYRLTTLPHHVYLATTGHINSEMSSPGWGKNESVYSVDAH